jgi:hypothetical protein
MTKGMVSIMYLKKGNWRGGSVVPKMSLSRYELMLNAEVPLDQVSNAAKVLDALFQTYDGSQEL